MAVYRPTVQGANEIQRAGQHQRRSTLNVRPPPYPDLPQLPRPPSLHAVLTAPVDRTGACRFLPRVRAPRIYNDQFFSTTRRLKGRILSQGRSHTSVTVGCPAMDKRDFDRTPMVPLFFRAFSRKFSSARIDLFSQLISSGAVSATLGDFNLSID